MIKCTACGTTNLDGSQYCDECGTLLTKSTQTAISENSQVQMGSVTSVGIPLIIEEPPSGNDPKALENGSFPVKKANAKLVIERGISIGKEFPLTKDESNIGRWDADNGIFPDVDLDIHDPEAKVSRRHARIIFEGGNFMIEDLGSTNGTFINRGRRLIPGSPHLLSEGDEIIVGKTFMRFHII